MLSKAFGHDNRRLAKNIMLIRLSMCTLVDGIDQGETYCMKL